MQNNQYTMNFLYLTEQTIMYFTFFFCSWFSERLERSFCNFLGFLKKYWNHLLNSNSKFKWPLSDASAMHRLLWNEIKLLPLNIKTRFEIQTNDWKKGNCLYPLNTNLQYFVTILVNANKYCSYLFSFEIIAFEAYVYCANMCALHKWVIKEEIQNQ